MEFDELASRLQHTVTCYQARKSATTQTISVSPSAAAAACTVKPSPTTFEPAVIHPFLLFVHSDIAIHYLRLLLADNDAIHLMHSLKSLCNLYQGRPYILKQIVANNERRRGEIAVYADITTVVSGPVRPGLVYVCDNEAVSSEIIPTTLLGLVFEEDYFDRPGYDYALINALSSWSSLRRLVLTCNDESGKCQFHSNLESFLHR